MMKNYERAEKFLSAQGLGFEALRAAVTDQTGDKLLMLIGSIPDGLANPLSDIDLLVVGSRRTGGDLLLREVEFEQTIERIESSHEVNIEYWPSEELADLAEKFHSMVQAIDHPEGMNELVVFSETQIRLIHYLVNGVVLSGNVEPWAEFFKSDDLINYLILYFVSFYYTLAEDAVGQIMVDDKESALANLRQAVDYLAGAELAVIGETNPYSKWRIKLLRRSKEMLGDNVFEGYLERLFPIRDAAKDTIDETIAFCESRIGAILQRRPQIVPAAMTLGAKMRFVTAPNP